MGYDLVAYVDVDHEQLAGMSEEAIKASITQKYPGDLGISYIYNEQCGMHEIYMYYGGTNFIRDDERFDNRRYQKMMETKVGQAFPPCLSYINDYVRTREDAIDVAAGLELFFKDDVSLMWFAEWLRKTAKFCSTYELSS